MTEIKLYLGKYDWVIWLSLMTIKSNLLLSLMYDVICVHFGQDFSDKARCVRIIYLNNYIGVGSFSFVVIYQIKLLLRLSYMLLECNLFNAVEPVTRDVMKT